MEKSNKIHGRDFANIPNPTNPVGGLFILGLQQPGGPFNVSPNPTNAVGGLFILGLQQPSGPFNVSPNPTNAVGGLFILGLQTKARAPSINHVDVALVGLRKAVLALLLVVAKYERSTNCVGGIRNFRAVTAVGVIRSLILGGSIYSETAV